MKLQSPRARLVGFDRTSVLPSPSGPRTDLAPIGRTFIMRPGHRPSGSALRGSTGMFQRFNHRTSHYALLLTAGAALFLLNLGGATLWDVDEGRNSTAAYEMLESGNPIIPTFNGALRSHKPALLYWLQLLAYS